MWSHTGRAETGKGKGNEREKQANERKMNALSYTGRAETGRGKEKAREKRFAKSEMLASEGMEVPGEVWYIWKAF